MEQLFLSCNRWEFLAPSNTALGPYRLEQNGSLIRPAHCCEKGAALSIIPGRSCMGPLRPNAARRFYQALRRECAARGARLILMDLPCPPPPPSNLCLNIIAYPLAETNFCGALLCPDRTEPFCCQLDAFSQANTGQPLWCLLQLGQTVRILPDLCNRSCPPKDCPPPRGTARLDPQLLCRFQLLSPRINECFIRLFETPETLYLKAQAAEKAGFCGVLYDCGDTTCADPLQSMVRLASC